MACGVQKLRILNMRQYIALIHKEPAATTAYRFRTFPA